MDLHHDHPIDSRAYYYLYYNGILSAGFEPAQNPLAPRLSKPHEKQSLDFDTFRVELKSGNYATITS